MITTTFVNNILEVLKNGRPIISQPFKPTSDGSQPNWVSEAEALAWWETVKEPYLYEPPVVEPPSTDNNISEEQPVNN
jgi:hypothetical protein